MLTLAAGLGAIASPAFAQTSGHVGLSYDHSELDAGGFEADGDAFALDGAVAIPTGGSFAVILDGTYSDSDDADGTIQGTAHFLSRNDSQAFGGFVGGADNDGDSAYFVGGEYAKFLSNSTIALSAGYGNLDDADADIYALGGEYRYFISDNFRLDGRAGYQLIEVTGSDDDGFNVGAGAEYRFGASPVSLFGGVDYAKFDDSDLDVTTATIGIRFDFGGESLKHRDRKGTTFGPLGGLGGALGAF